MRGIQIQSLGGKDPLEEGIATHSNILAWRIPGKRDPVLLDRGAWWAAVYGFAQSRMRLKRLSSAGAINLYYVPEKK